MNNNQNNLSLSSKIDIIKNHLFNQYLFDVVNDIKVKSINAEIEKINNKSYPSPLPKQINRPSFTKPIPVLDKAQNKKKFKKEIKQYKKEKKASEKNDKTLYAPNILYWDYFANDLRKGNDKKSPYEKDVYTLYKEFADKNVNQPIYEIYIKKLTDKRTEIIKSNHYSLDKVRAYNDQITKVTRLYKDFLAMKGKKDSEYLSGQRRKGIDLKYKEKVIILFGETLNHHLEDICYHSKENNFNFSIQEEFETDKLLKSYSEILEKFKQNVSSKEQNQTKCFFNDFSNVQIQNNINKFLIDNIKSIKENDISKFDDNILE